VSLLQRFPCAKIWWLCASLCWLWTAQIAAQPTAPIAQPPPAPDAPVVAPESQPAPPPTPAADSGTSAEVPDVAPDAGAPAVPPAVQVAPAAPAAVDVADDTRGAKGNGTLQGTVTDAEGGSNLEGADVYVRGEPIQTRADAHGRYRLDLPSGTYQISVIYPGYSTFTVSRVEIRPGKPANLNIELRAGSMVLDEFVITGSRVEGGIATLIAERRESTGVADVIGSEQMARSGDSNAAAALSRVTGITLIDGKYVIVRGMGERYSSMTLNRLQVASPDPTRRVVPLDLFPAGVIESVLVQKTYSPDLPGEFGGGLVQLRSRDYPNKFMVSINLATGANTNATFQDRLVYRGGDTDWLGIDDGTRALPGGLDNSRGRLVATSVIDPDGYSSEELDALGKSLPNIYNTRKDRAPPDLTLVASIGNEFRLRRAKLGFVAAAGYKNEYRSILNATNRAYQSRAGGDPEIIEDFVVDAYRQQTSLSGFVDWGVEFSKRQKLKATTMLLRQTDDGTQYRTSPEGRGPRRTILSWIERQILLQQVSGTHAFEALREFQVDWRYGFGRASRGEPDRRTYTYTPNSDGEYELGVGSAGNERMYGDTNDDTHEGQIDLTQPFRIWRRLQAKAKLGAVLYRRDRSADVRRFQFRVPQTGLDLTLAPESIFVPANINMDAGLLQFQESTKATDSYGGWMQLEGGYAMLELPVVRSLDLMGGARVEHAVIEVSTFDPYDDSLPPIKSRLDNVDVLPAATFTWRFLEDYQLRGGYSRTLNRPDFRELAESQYYDLDTNLMLTGNPDVKRAQIENYDLRIEWYYTPDEVFSIGGFLKDFEDPIEIKQAPTTDQLLFELENAPHARSYGLELEGRKRFGFITKVLDALYLASNFSLIRSIVDIDVGDGDVYHRPLQGQSPWVINVQLGWDGTGEGGTGTSASLLFNSAGRRIRIIGDPDPDNPVGDIYEEPIHRMDFVAAQDLPHGFKLGARVRNILNSWETWTADGNTWRKFRRGTDFQLGVSWAY
jgi:outer membrane receptor protein involved in Fe transport